MEQERKNKHRTGINLADQLAKKINWISPFDPGMLHRKIDAVQFGFTQGPMNIPLATLVLSGIFAAEGGTAETGGLRVEHVHTINLALVEKLGISASEKTDLYEVVQIALKALGWAGQKSEILATPADKPGTAIRWSWPFVRGGRVKTPQEQRTQAVVQ